jgi:hypothetical protein
MNTFTKIKRLAIRWNTALGDALRLLPDAMISYPIGFSDVKVQCSLQLTPDGCPQGKMVKPAFNRWSPHSSYVFDGKLLNLCRL